MAVTHTTEYVRRLLILFTTSNTVVGMRIWLLSPLLITINVRCFYGFWKTASARVSLFSITQNTKESITFINNGKVPKDDMLQRINSPSSLDLVSVNKLLSHYSKIGHISECDRMWTLALHVIAMIEKDGRSCNETSKEIAYSRMVKCCSDCGQWQRAFSITEDYPRQPVVGALMYSAGIQAISYPVALNKMTTLTLSQDGKAQSQLERLQLAQSLSSLLSGYLSAGRPDLLIAAYMAATHQFSQFTDVPIDQNVTYGHRKSTSVKGPNMPTTCEKPEPPLNVKCFNLFLAASKQLLLSEWIPSPSPSSSSERSRPPISPVGDDWAPFVSSKRLRPFQSPSELWTFAKTAILSRMESSIMACTRTSQRFQARKSGAVDATPLHSEPREGLSFDEYSATLALDLCACRVGGEAEDFSFALQVYEACQALGFTSARIGHALLRNFKSPDQMTPLRGLIASMSDALPSAPLRTQAREGTSVAFCSLQWDVRTSDETMHALLR